MTSSPQIAQHILMVRPAAFAANPQTAETNAFQSHSDDLNAQQIQARAVAEFDAACDRLWQSGVSLTVIADTPEPARADAVFPNNWFSTHADGTLVTYPLLSVNRRQEIRVDIIGEIRRRFKVTHHWALDQELQEGHFLEGTGSLVLDRRSSTAFACISPRTDESLVDLFCQRMKYSACCFRACDENGIPVYHTNVMMAILERQAVVCLESVVDERQREVLIKGLQATGKSIMEIGLGQMRRFAGNLLQVGRGEQRPVIVLSSTAAGALDASQRDALLRDSDFVELEIPTIEEFGGGSARCMMAEIFLSPL